MKKVFVQSRFKQRSKVFSECKKDLNEFLNDFLKELQECLFFVCLDLGGGVVTVVLQSGYWFSVSCIFFQVFSFLDSFLSKGDCVRHFLIGFLKVQVVLK